MELSGTVPSAPSDAAAETGSLFAASASAAKRLHREEEEEEERRDSDSSEYSSVQGTWNYRICLQS